MPDNDWAGKRVAVTGAGGFIGSHLVERLVENGARVRALVHYNSRNDWGHLEELPASTLSEIEIVAGDVTDSFGMQRFVAGQKVVFHLAALIGIPFSYVAPQYYVNVNIQGTLNILEACRSHSVERLVHTSTSEVYGTARYTPIDEDHPLQGQSPYSASKIAADKLAEGYHLSFGLPVITVRPFNTYGPRQSARAIVPTVITQALSGDRVRIGNPEPFRDITFVRDTAEGFIRAAETGKAIGKTLNLSSGYCLSIGQIARKILDTLGSRAELVLDKDRVRPEHSEVMKLEGNSEAVFRHTGWRPKVSLDEGLSRTIEYIRANLHRYKPGIYNV